MHIKIHPQIKEAFPRITVACTGVYSPGSGTPNIAEWDPKIRERWNLETMKDDPTIRAYRDFFWKLGIDPTKVRPAGEALIRVCHRRGLPTISPVVDAMNIASALTAIPLSSFDVQILSGDPEVRFSKKGEMYYPHTGNPWELSGKEVVLVDDHSVLCLYPYRDSKFALIQKDTRRLITVAYGAPGVSDLVTPVKMMLQLIGTQSGVSVFD